MKKNKSNTDEIVFDAIKVVPGLALGPAFTFHRATFDLDDLNYEVNDIEKEVSNFLSACEETKRQLREIRRLNGSKLDSQLDGMFESQIAFLEDEFLQNEIREVIVKKNRSAAYAVFRVLQRKKEYFLNLENEYFRDRAFDILDLKNRLLQTLAGVSTDYSVATPSIIFSDSLSPSDTVHFNRDSILGFVTDTGGRTSHAAIMAKSLHIPYVINNFSLAKLIQPTDYVILDGLNGKLIINPGKETIKSYKKIKRKFDSTHKKLRAETNLPATTKDGTDIVIMANVEFMSELEEAAEVGAHGIGLLRTEGLFLEREKIPTEEEQFEIYKKFAEGLSGEPVIIRTIDAGGDKILTEIQSAEEQNPFLGWRAIRFCLDEPEIFKTQLRAILRANQNGNIRILIPMVSLISEIEKTKKLINQAKAELDKQGISYQADIKIGIMIETPSAAIMADEFAQEVDFFSIGSNDLTQYTLAVDRTNNKISAIFDDMDPSVLRLIRMTVQTAIKNNIEVSVCGEMAGNPEAVPLLLGLGLRILSVNPGQIPIIKKTIRNLSLSECEKLAEKALRQKKHEDIDRIVRRFIRDKISDIEYLT
jgi:phosphotransferase system enzyme I (PtsI)